MPAWVAGYNLTGYMPDPDNVYVVEEFESALAYIDDAIERHADHAYDGEMEDEVQEADHARERIAEIKAKRHEENFYESVGYTSYWVEWSDEASPEEDE